MKDWYMMQITKEGKFFEDDLLIKFCWSDV